ncbi:MAG: hypothetical protein K9K67_11495 [Bacteriovoracaceae bacterium]|nr:hypothetical protein [Bacteriovoracaceae bacterium]
MLKLLYVLTIFMYASISLAEMTVDQIVLELNNMAATATDAVTNCDGKDRQHNLNIELSGDPSLYHKKIKLSLNGERQSETYKGDSVSVLTKEEADKLFQEFSQISYMKFDYLHDGCFARAHEFALIAKENGIEMGKVFLTDSNDDASLYPKEWRDNDKAPVPNGFYGWRYHVTPYVLVREGNKLVPYVFDVGVSEGAKPVDQWRKDTSFRTNQTELTYRDRGIMFPGTNYSYGDSSNIEGQLQDQENMRSLGINEFLYQREQGWL